MAYGDNADMDDYWSELGYAVAGITDEQKTVARNSASRYVDGLGYRQTGVGTRVPLWPGEPMSATQNDEWPRSGAKDVYGNDIDSSTVPERIKRATYEAAYFIAAGGDVNRSVATDQVVVREKVDVIETQYAEGSTKSGYVDTRPVIPAVMDILAPLIGGGRYGITMVTAL